MSDWIVIRPSSPDSPAAAPPAPRSAGLAERARGGPEAAPPARPDGSRVSPEARQSEAPRSWIFMPSYHTSKAPAAASQGGSGFAWGGNGTSGSMTRHSTSHDGRGSYETRQSQHSWGPDGQVQSRGSVTRHSTLSDGRGSYDHYHTRESWGPDGQVHRSGSRTTVSRMIGPWGSDTYRVREEWKDGQYRRSGSHTSTSTFHSPWGSETYRYQQRW